LTLVALEDAPALGQRGSGALESRLDQPRAIRARHGCECELGERNKLFASDEREILVRLPKPLREFLRSDGDALELGYAAAHSGPQRWQRSN
jgi:hypothetical protein